MELLGMRFEDAVKFEIPSSVSDENLKIVLCWHALLANEKQLNEFIESTLICKPFSCSAI